MTNEKTKNPFSIGDIVYVIGKTALEICTNKARLDKAKISHIEHRQFVAYGIDDNFTWKFSKKHFNKCVFKDEQIAIEVFNKWGYDKMDLKSGEGR